MRFNRLTYQATRGSAACVDCSVGMSSAHTLQPRDLRSTTQAQLQKEAEEDEEVYEKLACWCAGTPRETAALQQACNFIVVSVVQRAQKRCRSVISIP